MKQKSLLRFAFVLIALTAFCTHAGAAPDFTLIEAEAAPQGTVKADRDASSGKYVAQEGAYQPLLMAEIPSSAGDSFVVWARVRGAAMQLKGVSADGVQHDFNWVWARSAEWKWVSFGRHTRTELGVKLLLIQGPDAGQDAGIDAIILARDDAFTPDDLTLSLPPLLPVEVTINWNRVRAKATSLSYGLNAFGGFDPETTHNAAYEANMATMDAGLLRLHNWDMMKDSKTERNGWIDTANHCWDAEKIKKDLNGSYVYGPKLMINIPGWPAWMDTDKDGFLDAGREADYARFCAQLVQIVNRETGRPAAYWEVTNEQDGRYFGDFHQNGGALKDLSKPDRVAELADIYNACALAMKSADRTIKVGGPAMARPDWTDFVVRFTARTAPNLDFFSYHVYASGSRDDADRQIFERTDAFGTITKQITGILKAAVPHRHIPAFLDEYNISWTWETRDSRMTTVKGAVFDALSLVSAVTSGADAALAWNEKDGIYGKMDDAFQPRPGMNVFHLFNRYLVGDAAETSTSDPEAVVAYAVNSAGQGRKSLLLINRSKHDRNVILNSRGWTFTSAKPWTLCRLNETGYSERVMPGSQWASPSILLPSCSLTLFTQSH